MPVRAKKGSIDYTYISTEPFYLLSIPEWECVIVPMGYEYSIFSDSSKVVVCKFRRSVSVAAVMIIPVLGGHQCGDSHAGTYRDCSDPFLPSCVIYAIKNLLNKSQAADSYPCTEEIE